MPYINIRVTREGVSIDQKAALIRGVTEVITDVLGKDPALTHVVIDEIDVENWGVAGASVLERSKAN